MRMSHPLSPQAIRQEQIKHAKYRFDSTVDILCRLFDREIEFDHPEKDRVEVNLLINDRNASKQRPDAEALQTEFTNRLVVAGWEVLDMSLKWAYDDKLDAKIVVQFPTKETVANSSPYRG